MNQSIILKEQIINTAKHYFYNEGYEKTTIRKIAKDLGIYHSNILYHFKNKEEILRYIYKELYKKSIESITEIKSDLNNTELIVSSMYVTSYSLSFNKKFRRLYFESSDIIVEVLYTEYAKEYYPRIEHSSINFLSFENRDLVDLAVMVNAEKTVFTLHENNGKRINFKDLMDYKINLFGKLREIDGEIYEHTKKNAELIARKIDYSRLNIFDDSYKITLDD